MNDSQDGDRNGEEEDWKMKGLKGIEFSRQGKEAIIRWTCYDDDFQERCERAGRRSFLR